MWKPTAAICVAVVVVVAAATFSAGCGSHWDDDDDYRYPPAGRQDLDKTVFVYLNISDQDGEPLPGVTVWVDGTSEEEKSSDEFEQLGRQFPPDWRGWEYNWSGGPYFIDLYRCSQQVCKIEVLVSRSGWQSQKTHLNIGPTDPDEIYFRQTFVMEPSRGVSTAAVEAPRPAEKTGL